jgi:hypothetical protein
MRIVLVVLPDPHRGIRVRVGVEGEIVVIDLFI